MILLPYIVPSYALNSYNHIGKEKQIILSIGEHKQISLKSLKKFTTSNKDTLGVKYLKSSSKLLIKGKKQGFSEVVVWTKSNILNYKVFVYSKYKQLKLIAISSALQSIGLSTKMIGNQLSVEGTLTSEENLRLLKNIIQNNKQVLLYNVIPSISLTKKIVGDLYLYFDQHYGKEVYCDNTGVQYNCQYSPSYSISKNELNYLKEKFPVKLFKGKKDNKNLLLKVKVIQVEKLNSLSTGTGFESFNINPKQIIDNNFSQISFGKGASLNSNQYDVETIASPKIMMRLDKEIKIRAGSNHPSSEKSNENDSGPFFTGLEIIAKLSKTNGLYLLSFTSSLGNHQGEGVVDNHSQNSSIFLNVGKAEKIFDIDLKSHANKERKVPFFSKIPIIGAIFKGHEKKKSNKKIIAVVKIEEI